MNKVTESALEGEESGIQWVNTELDSELEGFQGEKTPTKPPLQK